MLHPTHSPLLAPSPPGFHPGPTAALSKPGRGCGTAAVPPGARNICERVQPAQGPGEPGRAVAQQLGHSWEHSGAGIQRQPLCVPRGHCRKAPGWAPNPRHAMTHSPKNGELEWACPSHFHSAFCASTTFVPGFSGVENLAPPSTHTIQKELWHLGGGAEVEGRQWTGSRRGPQPVLWIPRKHNWVWSQLCHFNSQLPHFRRYDCSVK